MTDDEYDLAREHRRDDVGPILVAIVAAVALTGFAILAADIIWRFTGAQ